MDQRFVDATPEELQRADHICIICREEMGPNTRNKKLRCNHVFHMHCLRWDAGAHTTPSGCQHLTDLPRHYPLGVCWFRL